MAYWKLNFHQIPAQKTRPGLAVAGNGPHSWVPIISVLIPYIHHGYWGRLALEGWGVLLSGEKKTEWPPLWWWAVTFRAPAAIGLVQNQLLWWSQLKGPAGHWISWHFSCFRKSLQCPSTITWYHLHIQFLSQFSWLILMTTTTPTNFLFPNIKPV